MVSIPMMPYWKHNQSKKASKRGATHIHAEKEQGVRDETRPSALKTTTSHRSNCVDPVVVNWTGAVEPVHKQRATQAKRKSENTPDSGDIRTNRDEGHPKNCEPTRALYQGERQQGEPDNQKNSQVAGVSYTSSHAKNEICGGVQGSRDV